MTVSGPVTGGEIALRAGQRLLVDLPRGETVISEQKPEEWLDAPADRAARGGTARRATVRGVRQTCRAGGEAGLDGARGAGPTAIAGGPRRWRPGISTASSPRPSTPV